MIAGAEFDLEKQDVFLFGLLVYWMYRNRLPWKRYPFDVNEKESWIFEQKWDMNNTYSGRFKEFFSKTLNYDPEQRESATELTSRVEEIKAERDEASSQPDQRLDHVTSREPAKISLKHRLQNEKWTVVAWYRHINVSLELRMRCRW